MKESQVNFSERENPNAPPGSDTEVPKNVSSNDPDPVPTPQSTAKSSVETEATPETAPSTPRPGGNGLQSDAASKVTVATQPTTPSEPQVSSNDVLIANVSDLPSSDDSLGFAPYVQAIASFLTNAVTKPPLTLSIEGEWGSGKSSFMLQLKEKLRGKVRIVDFNAWRYDKDDAMWAAFALEFARKLAGELSPFVRWWAHVRLFFKRFQWERGWTDMVRLLLMILGILSILLLPILIWDRITAVVTSADSFSSFLGSALGGIVRAGGILGYFGLVVLLWLKLKTIVANPLKINLKQYLNTPDYKSRVAFVEHFHQDFKNVAKVYGRGEKVCVFIDDLDRCEVPKAADLMQALNLMISDDKDSQLIFIMGMDREKVAAGLAVKYEKLLPYLAPAPAGNGHAAAAFDPVLGLEYGYGFIEKFIQLPFHVPQATDTQVDKFLKKLSGATNSSTEESQSPKPVTTEGEKAVTTVTKDSEKVTEILKIVAPTFEYNPRRLKQFINAFRLKTFIAKELCLFDPPSDASKYDQLTIEQIGKFVAIGLRWPLLLPDLDNERDLLSRLQTLVRYGVRFNKLETLQEGVGRVLKEELEIPAEPVIKLKVTPALARWYRRDNLREFLRLKLFTKEVNQETDQTYSLEKLDVNVLLRVSPIPAPRIASTTNVKSATATSNQTAT